MGSGWVLSPMKMVLIRDRKEDTDTQRRRPREEGGRDGSDVATRESMLRIASKHQKLEQKLPEILP